MLGFAPAESVILLPVVSQSDGTRRVRPIVRFDLRHLTDETVLSQSIRPLVDLPVARLIVVVVHDHPGAGLPYTAEIAVFADLLRQHGLTGLDMLCLPRFTG